MAEFVNFFLQIITNMVTILDYNEFKKKALSNPKVKAEYDSLESEFALFDEMVHLSSFYPALPSDSGGGFLKSRRFLKRGHFTENGVGGRFFKILGVF